jgi:hypothetical protein
MTDNKIRDFITTYSNTIKDTLLIPSDFELKLINSGKYSTLVFTKRLWHMEALYTGTLEDIYKFLIIVVKINSLREENKFFIGGIEC